jgi:hypothetical protein
MKYINWIRWTPVWSLAAILLLAAGMMHCGNVPLTAPSGAELNISANPTAIPAYNGVSTITVVGFESFESGDGGPLPNGTQIFFTTNVGIIEERVEMQNGRALAYLRSNGRAGVANVTARSGGGISAALEGDSAVQIGNTNDINIVLSANPATVTSPDFTTEITATVFDNSNNALAAVPLVFTTNAGSLASAGSTLRTNAQGKATDRLTLEDESSATVTVFSGSVSATLTIGRETLRNPIVTSISPTSGQPGQTLSVTITGLNFQPGALVSFGEGISVNSVTFISSTLLVANITIDPEIQNTSSARTVTVTNPDGGSGNLPSAFRITTLNPAPEITSLNPTSTAQRGVNVTVTVNGLNFVSGAQVSLTSAAGSVNVISTTFVNSTQIQVVILVDPAPPGGTGPPAGTVFQVTVINPDGLRSNSVAFTVN